MSELDRFDPTVRSKLDAMDADEEVLPCDPELADTATFCDHFWVRFCRQLSVVQEVHLH
jgi:hypothetical protein